MPEKEDGIVIDETEETQEQETSFDIEGLSDGEITLAKEHGLYEEKEDGVQIEGEKQDEGEKEVAKENNEEKTPSFEQIEDDEKLIEKYNKNEKALYWKWKTDKQKRQEAQSRVKEMEDKLKFLNSNDDNGKKLEKIKDLLNNPDSLTVEALQQALEEKVELEKKEELDNAEVIKNKVSQKAMFAEKIGKAKYERFDDITILAKEMIAEDKSKTYQKLIDDSFMNDDVDEDMLVERVVNIARMNQKFNEVMNRVEPEKKEEVSRVLNNSKKKVSSASLSGASGRRIISEKELTVAQASRLTTEQWAKLKPETQKRILMGIDP
jgi:hypothetical protein